MKLINLLTIAVAGLGVWALYLYFRPPDGDLQPISKDAILHYKLKDGRQGDTGYEDSNRS